MQNLKMVCHNLNWSFNTCLLKDWRRQGDKEGDTHNIPLGSLCAAQPPILKPTFLSIGGWGIKYGMSRVQTVSQVEEAVAR